MFMGFAMIVSCGNDDDGKSVNSGSDDISSQLVGTWTLISCSESGAPIGGTYTFYNDKSGYSSADDENFSFLYNSNGDFMMTYLSSGNSVIGNFTISGDTFSGSYKWSGKSTTHTMTLKKGVVSNNDTSVVPNNNTNNSNSGGGSTTKACAICHGSAKCHLCQGKGYGGSGSFTYKCSLCKGTGKCSFCEGTGYRVVSGGGNSGGTSNGNSNNETGKRCSICGGDGECSSGSVGERCYGSGVCGYCDGKGTAYYNGVKDECHLCGGSGKCTYCKGTGKCSSCGGKGYY